MTDVAAPVGRVSDGDEVSRFIERFAAELTEAGMQRMAARVFAALLASDSGTMTSAELADRLQISPAAVSGAIRYLSQVNMVGRERQPGSRRDRYRLHDELWYETFTRRDQLLTRWEKIMRDGAEALGAETPAGARVAETADFFAFLYEEMAGVMDRWRERQAKQAAGAPSGATRHPDDGSSSTE
jgi:predicted transcriptional regulator